MPISHVVHRFAAHLAGTVAAGRSRVALELYDEWRCAVARRDEARAIALRVAPASRAPHAIDGFAPPSAREGDRPARARPRAPSPRTW